MRPPPGTVLCRFDDLPEPGVKSFDFLGFKAFVVRKNGDVRGWLDLCPHAGWALGVNDARRLTRDGAYLLCTGHGALFRHEDGVCVAGPCEGRALTPWPVKVSGEVILTA